MPKGKSIICVSLDWESHSNVNLLLMYCLLLFSIKLFSFSLHYANSLYFVVTSVLATNSASNDLRW